MASHCEQDPCVIKRFLQTKIKKMSEKAEIPVEQLQKVNLKKTETIEKQVLPSAEGKIFSNFC